MIGAPGSTRFEAVGFNVNINVWVCIMDNGDTYLAPNGGTVYYNLQDLSYAYNPWNLYVYGYQHDFKGTASTEGIWFNNATTGASISNSEVKDFINEPNGVILTGSSGSANASCSITTTTPPSVGSASVPSGFTKVAPIANWSKKQNGNLYYYILGWVDTRSYSAGTQEAIAMSSQEIIITRDDIPELFEFFPWERRMLNTWYSLNREGPDSTNAGLYRKTSGSWSPLKNKYSGTPNHGFRYSNGWQRSPKTGTGA